MSSPSNNNASAWSLARTLAWSHISLVTLTVIGFAVAMWWAQYRASVRQVESELFGASEAMRQSLKSGVEPEDLSIPDSFFHRFGRAPRDQAYWVLWSPEAEPIAWGGRFPEGTSVSALSPFPLSSKPKGPRPFQSERNGRTIELMVVAGDNRLMIARPMGKEFDALGTLGIRLLGGVLVSISVAALIAIWVSKRIATPISDLAARTRDLTHERLHERLDANQSISEINGLANAFNRMLENLQRAFERQKQFTADAAHELRTPVSVVLAQSEHCLARTRSDEDYRAGFETTRSTAIHMRQLVQDLIDLARMDDGLLALQLTPVDLAMVGREAVTMMSPVAAEKSITIEVMSSPAMVHGDRLRLRQIFLNLLANAIQYSDSGKRVWVAIIDDDHAARMTIRDEGIGMSESEQSLVWNRFYRVDAARTVETRSSQRDQSMAASGTGLGLSLVAELVRMHQGKIEMVSAPGAGTAVTVTFSRNTVD